MEEHPIQGIMNTTMEKIKQMVDVNTIIGDPINVADGTVIIPVSKVSYGFASGGSDFQGKQERPKDLFGGGTGAGITITPVAFLTISGGEVKMLQVDPYVSPADRVIGLVPEVVDKIGSLFKKDGKKPEKGKKTEEKPSEGTVVQKDEIKLDDPEI